MTDPTPPTESPQTLEERAREIIWRVAVWQDDDEDPLGNCTWAYALEYEDEMGELIPRAIDAAREVHALYADDLARLRAELAEARDDLRRECEASEHHRIARDAAEARAARLEEALEELLRVSGWASAVSTYDEWRDAAIAARRALTEGADR